MKVNRGRPRAPHDFLHALFNVFGAFRVRLASGFLWSLVSAVSLQGSVMLTGLILARMLGLQVFGAYALATATVMTVVGVTQGGVGIIGTKFVGEFLHAHPERVSRVLRMCAVFTSVTGFISTAMLWALAPFVARHILDNPDVESALRWASVGVLFHVQTVYLQGALQGFGAFRVISRAGAMVGLLHCILSAVGAWKFGLEGAVIAFTLSSAARWWAFRGALRVTCHGHAIKKAKRIERDDWDLIWRFALPAGLASLVTLPCLWGVTALVARQPGGMAWVGVFSVAHQLRQLLLQLPVLLNTVTASVLSRLKGQGEGKEYWRVFRANLFVGVGFTTVVVAVMAALSNWVLGLYGPGFVEGRSLLLLLLLAVIPEVAGVTAYQLVQSSGRMWRSLLLIVGPRDLMYLGLAALALPQWGLAGAGLAYLIAYSFGCVATFLVGIGGREQLPVDKVVS